MPSLRALVASATIFLAACNPLATDLRTEIVGRWESQTWNNNGKPLFVEFDANGDMWFLGFMATTWTAKWIILDSGELQVAHGSGEALRCRVSINNKIMTIQPPTCLNWNEVGGSIDLVKQ